MRLIFFTIYLGILHGQVLDEMYHTTDEIYEFLDTLNRSEHVGHLVHLDTCLLYTSPSPRDTLLSRMPSSA